jgi:flagellar biogenesis protein FliO
MSRRTRASIVAVLGLALAAPLGARADEAPGRAGHSFKSLREGASRSTSAGKGSPSAWWAGTAGLVAVLAAVGALSVAARRLRPRDPSGPGVGPGLKVIGRVGLSPRHAVHLVRAGDRVLILGTGPQGAPTLLGDLPGEGGDA